MKVQDINLSQNDYKFLKDNVQYLEQSEKDYMTLIPHATSVRFKDIYERYTKDFSISINCSKCLLRMVQTLNELYKYKKEQYRANDNRNKNK